MRSSATSRKRYTLPLARVSILACNVEVTNESHRYERDDGGERSDNDLIFEQDCESKKHPRNRRKNDDEGTKFHAAEDRQEQHRPHKSDRSGPKHCGLVAPGNSLEEKEHRPEDCREQARY